MWRAEALYGGTKRREYKVNVTSFRPNYINNLQVNLKDQV